MREDYVRGNNQPEDGIYGLAPQPVQNTGIYQDGLRAMPEPVQDVPTPVAGIDKPRKQEMLSNYEINIKFLSVGCVVRVGCKEIAFTTVREAMTAINDYVKNPHGESERWWKIFSEQE